MKNRRMVGFVLLTVLCCAYFGQAALSAQTKSDPPQSPIEVQLSQKHDSGPLWLAIVDKVAWPLVAAVAILIFWRPLYALVDAFGKRGTDFTIGSVAIRIPALESKVADQQGQINLQNEQIRNLIKFSMSWYIYNMLFQDKESADGRRRVCLQK